MRAALDRPPSWHALDSGCCCASDQVLVCDGLVLRHPVVAASPDCVRFTTNFIACVLGRSHHLAADLALEDGDRIVALRQPNIPVFMSSCHASSPPDNRANGS